MKLAIGMTLIHSAPALLGVEVTTKHWIVVSFDKAEATLRGIRGSQHNKTVTLTRAQLDFEFAEEPRRPVEHAVTYLDIFTGETSTTP